MVTLGRIIYALYMVDAIDPARLDRLPADVRAAFEAQVKALPIRLSHSSRALGTEAFRIGDVSARAEKSNLAAENAFLKETTCALSTWCTNCAGRFAYDRRNSIRISSSWSLRISRSRSQKSSSSSDADPGRPMRPMSDVRNAVPAPCQRAAGHRVGIEPASIPCPCGCGTMVKIGEDRSERLDITPAQLRVIVTIRPRYACPKGRAGVTQAPVPAQLIQAGLPTEALIAHVIVSKYSEHLPLYRQAQIFARHGVAIERSTLADWVGRAAFHLAPIVERMAELLKRSSKLFMDETTAPVLDPGRGKTKTGYLWALARDDRPFGGTYPRASCFATRPGAAACMRKRCSSALMACCRSTALPATIGCKGLTARAALHCGSPIEAMAGAKLSRPFQKLGSPVGDEILQRIAGLYVIEKQIRGTSPEQRRAVRQQRAKPLVAELEAFIRAQRERLSSKSTWARARRSCQSLARALPRSRRWPGRNGIQPGREPHQASGFELQKFTVRRPRRRSPELGSPGLAHRHLQAQWH